MSGSRCACSSDASPQQHTLPSAPGATNANTDGNRLKIPPLSRRRDKPQLSCGECRRRKVRCDRLQPCSNCSSRGLKSLCIYPVPTTTTTTSKPTTNAASRAAIFSDGLYGTAANTQDRINKLENLVLNLMCQTAPGSTTESHASPTEQSESPLAASTSSPNTPHRHEGLERAFLAVGNLAPETQREVSPSPSDFGSIRIQQTGVSYVSSSHWAAILDSIADLRSDFAHLHSVDSVEPLTSFPKPKLLYSSSMHATPASIIEAVPPRPIVDRLVSRYFHVLDIAPGVVHGGQFFREVRRPLSPYPMTPRLGRDVLSRAAHVHARIQYEKFWAAPHATPIAWVGQLFSMMCLSTQLQQAFLVPAKASPALGQWGRSSRDHDSEITADVYREKIVQCLVLSHYTKGGPYILETLILYFLVECFHLRAMETGIWMLVGIIVQTAMHMGYHKDAKHFPNISPFAGEMRRRVWAMVLQLDFSVSTQSGLPRLIKEGQTDTEQPRNLDDSDFDEQVTVLPASRPETEITPMLYVLAKLRLLSVGVKVAEMANEPQPHLYAQVLELDHQINEAQSTLPSSLKWNGLASSLNVPSQIIIQRIWLEVTVQQLKIVLHRKFLEPCRIQQQFTPSRIACVNAAMRILELQHLIDEETEVDGLFYQNRWRISSAFTNDFLLATSVLCFCLRNRASQSAESLIGSRDDEVTSHNLDRIKQLLKTSEAIWSRQSVTSSEARRATAALRHVLGREDCRQEGVQPMPFPPVAVSYFSEFNSHTQDYETSNPGLEPTMDGAAWPPLFSSTINTNIEQWAGAPGLQYMDMSNE